MANAAPAPRLAAISEIAGLVGHEPPPKGRRATLPGRGDIFVRGLRAPGGARPVVLLHGWVASAGLNWFRVFDQLREHYRVIAPDLRGHGRGIRSWRPFRLADCADDVAALLRKRRLRGAIVVGYSMGGPVAKLLWRRHPDLVDGLVLAATSGQPARSRALGRTMTAIMGGAALAGRAASLPRWLRGAAEAAALDEGPEGFLRLPDWARAEMRRHDVRHLLEAGAELGRYDASPWLGEIDVPTSVLVTERDAAIPPRHQRALAEGIRRSRVHTLPGGHLSFARPTFGKAIRRAVDSVTARASRS